MLQIRAHDSISSQLPHLPRLFLPFPVQPQPRDSCPPSAAECTQAKTSSTSSANPRSDILGFAPLAQENQATASQETPERVGIQIDKENYVVWIEGRHVSLPRQGYELLCYLHEHANQVRTRRDIVEEVFLQKYDETDESQTRRLNTAIRRLRERIEPDPDRPRYLLTEPGRGYRLVLG